MVENGIIVIDKEKDMTSHDVVAIMRGILHMKKVGHTGTLDPMATGVLPICFGRSTRIMEYLDSDIKVYRCTLKFGRSTDTLDIWGSVVDTVSEDRVNSLSEEAVRSAVMSFDGVIDQVPPMYSAIKVDGRRLYKYAREGRTVEVKSRRVFVQEPVIEGLELGKGYESSVTFSIGCSKGTYIRAICRDIGEKLGVPAAMSDLDRISSGIFDKEHAVTISELEKMDEAQLRELIYEPDEPLVNLGRVNFSDYNGKRLSNGIKIPIEEAEIISKHRYHDGSFPLELDEKFIKLYRAYDSSGFIGIVYPENGEFRISKNFRG